MRKLTTKEDISDLLSASAASIALGAAIETNVTFTVKESGTFAYYCTVSGHRPAGQEGWLVVQERGK